MAASLRVTLRKSVVSSKPDTRRTASALGLRRIGDTSTLPDNPAVRGQLRAVRHLVEVVETPADGAEGTK
jgi:large subunit ribosomal protein L30